MSDLPAQRLRASYDRVAPEYARRIAGELADKPFDRDLLDRFAASIDHHGPVYDVGCGPGHVSRHLADHGIRTLGLDLSAGQVREARARFADLPFVVADMRALPAAPGSLAGIVACYSIIHLTPAQLGPAFQGFHEALGPRGRLLLAFHIGSEVEHVADLWGYAVDLDFVFFQPEDIADLLKAAGFLIDAVLERGPYPEVEVQTRRAYLLATRS